MKELINKYKVNVALVGATIVITSTIGQCSLAPPAPQVEEIVEEVVEEVEEVVEEPSPSEEAPTPSEEVDAAE